MTSSFEKFTKITGPLAAILMSTQVPSVPAPQATSAAHEIVKAVEESKDIAIVQVKSAWTSKINWVQAAGLVASAAAYFGLQLTADQVLGVIAAIQTVTAVVTWVVKTWFSNSVTSASAGKS